MPSLAVRCRRLVVLAICCGLLVSGCGEEGDNYESVYLYVFNGYPGGEAIDLVGPTGMVVTDLQFGERTEEPIRVDRNLGTEFTLLIDGAPESFDASQQLYNLYPQETATFVLSQREDNMVTTKLLRHVQGISPACRLVVDNSLSLISDNLGEYNAILGWDLDGRLGVAGFDRDYEEEELDEEDYRDETWAELEAHPMFAVADGDDEDEGLDQGVQLVWLGPQDRVDPPRVMFDDGSVYAEPPSEQYVECIRAKEQAQEALEAAQQGDLDLEYEEIQELMQILEMDCNEPAEESVIIHEPGEDEVVQAFHYYPADMQQADERDCSMDHQIFTDFGNVFEGEGEYDGYEENTRVSWSTDFQISDHYYLVLYGRPVNPLFEHWRASDHLGEIPDYHGDVDREEIFSGDGDATGGGGGDD